VSIDKLIAAAREHAERVANDPAYKPYKELIAKKEQEFKDQSYTRSVDKSFMARSYNL
jgi:hypothetical protein